MRLVCFFYRHVFRSAHDCNPPHTLTPPSSLSLLLAVQIYVAFILSSDPSHLENAASDAYVGSRVSCLPCCVPPPRACRP